MSGIWHIRWTVVTALTSPYEHINSLKIGAGYEAPPRRRRVGLHQPRHGCPKDRANLQACVIHAMVAEATHSIQRKSILNVYVYSRCPHVQRFEKVRACASVPHGVGATDYVTN